MATSDAQTGFEWLQELVGEWTYTAQSEIESENPEEHVSGIETGRTLGTQWLLLESRGNMPGGGEGKAIMTLGFDPGTGHFVGTWIGSMMPQVWTYTGHLDDTGRQLILESEGPSFHDPNKIALYRDTIEKVSDTERTLTGSVQEDDGQWTTFMTTHFRRQ